MRKDQSLIENAVSLAMEKRAGRKPSEDVSIERLTDILVFSTAAMFFENVYDGEDASEAHLAAGEKLFRRYYDAQQIGVEKYILPLVELPNFARFKPAVERSLRTQDRSNYRHFVSNVMPLITHLMLQPVKFREVFTGRSAKVMRTLINEVWAKDDLDYLDPKTLAPFPKIPSVSAAPALRAWSKQAAILCGISLASEDVDVAVADAETASNIGDEINKIDHKIGAADPMTQESADLQLERIDLQSYLQDAVDDSQNPALSLATAVQALKSDATPDYLRNLDDEKIAYIYSEGKTLLNAGAGSGKTLGVTCRIKYLIEEKGVHPDQIIACSFTKAASAEIADRLKNKFGIEGKYIGRTSNSLAYNIVTQYRPDLAAALRNGSKADALMRYAFKQLTLKGTESYVSNRANSPYATRAIAVDNPSLSWIHMGREPVDSEGKPIRFRQLTLTISKWKNDLYKPEDARQMPNPSPYHRAATAMYAAYEWLKRYEPTMAPCLDFDDQHVVAYETLRDNAQIRDRIQGQFRVVIIDEGQDYNKLQMKLFGLISGKAEYVDYVGDDRQSIYGFRGAAPEEFVNLRDIGDFKVLNMQTNYRSGSAIVNAGEQLIAYNTDQLPKTCRAEISRGDGLIRYESPESHQEAAMRIATEIQEGITNGGADPSAFGVVVRNNAEKDAIMLSLIARGIPYRSNSDTDYFNNPAVRSMLAWVGVATMVDPSEVRDRTEALKTALKFPSFPDFKLPYRYLENLEGKYRSADLVGDVMRDRTKDAGVQQLQKSIDSLERLAMQEDTGLLISAILNLQGQTGSMLSVLAEGVDVDKMIEEGLNPDEITKEMMEERVLATFQPIRDLAAVRPTPRAFLDVLRKLKAANVKCKKGAKSSGNVEPAVQVDTCHQWKGLEAESVFVVMAKGVWPSSRNENPKAIAEERRLAYVAITRGRDRVKVLCPEMAYNGMVGGGVSQFVLEACIHPEESMSVKKAGKKIRKSARRSMYEIASLMDQPDFLGEVL